MKPEKPRLSICITTFNRGDVIGETLQSVLAQVTDDCEVIVLDGGSTDATERVVSEYARHCSSLRYFRQSKNNGFDADCDRAVQLARGAYCWLMTDDDLMKLGAVATVMAALRRNPSLVILNLELRDRSMSRVIHRRYLNFDIDRVYGPDEMDRVFVEVGDVLMYVGGIVIRREIWLCRQRKPYYGSWFIHVGVIFQARLPGETMVLAEPVISYRCRNAHTFSPHLVDIIWVKWPSLVETLALSGAAKKKLQSAEPWRHHQQLMILRGLGRYSLREYRLWIRPRSQGVALLPLIVALLPGVLVNALGVVYYHLIPQRRRNVWLHGLRDSRYHFRNWQLLRRG